MLSPPAIARHLFNAAGLAMLGLLIASCSGDVRVASNSFCDGIEQPSENGVDSPFDADGDGYFDAENTDCAEAYEAEFLDCDDNDAEINPRATEVQCDDTDNDCDAATLEAEDADEDGVLACTDCDDNDADQTNEQDIDFDEDGSDACFDCDDNDPANFPGNPEICDNRDNDCSGVADDGEDCFTDYSGTWVVTPAVSYACAGNNVTLNVGALTITDAGTVVVVAGVGGSQPGAMNGTKDGDNFTAENIISSGGAGCQESYAITGSFLSMSEFTATLTAEFLDESGTGIGCGDDSFFTPPCTNQSWSITGSR